MSKSVDEKNAANYVENGKFIGRSMPSSETKGMWWQVYELDGQYCAVIFDEEMGASFGEEINADEIYKYIEVDF